MIASPRTSMTPSPQVLVGVDGGNTKTLGFAAAPDGTILGSARVLLSSDIYAVPPEVAIERHNQVAEQACADAGIEHDGLRSVTAAFSLAGADWPEDIAFLEDGLRRRWPGATVVNDALGALRVAIPKGPGVVVVCGTGAATGARGKDGRTWHASFWQEPQGAWELGVRTLQAIYRAELGIDPPTALTERILAATGEPDVESLLHHASAREVAARRDPGSLAWILLDTAEAGDPTAIAIVSNQGELLGRWALAAARRVGLDRTDSFCVARTGGVLRHPTGILRDAIIRTVLADAPSATLVGSTPEPAAGAVLLAFDAAGLPADADVQERIEAGIAASGLVDTHPLRRGAA